MLCFVHAFSSDVLFLWLTFTYAIANNFNTRTLFSMDIVFSMIFKRILSETIEEQFLHGYSIDTISMICSMFLSETLEEELLYVHI